MGSFCSRLPVRGQRMVTVEVSQDSMVHPQLDQSSTAPPTLSPPVSGTSPTSCTTSPGGQSSQVQPGQASQGQAPTGQAPTGQTSPIPGQAQPIGPSPPSGGGGQEQTPLVPPTSPPQANQPTAVPGQAQPIRPATPSPPPPTAQVDRNRECGICRQPVLVHHRMFGLLENCHHCFDISCLLTWMTDRDTCPVCRIPTGRVLMWTRWIDSPHDKQRIFNLQYHCHNLAIRVAQRTRRTGPGGGGFTLGGTAVPGGGGTQEPSTQAGPTPTPSSGPQTPHPKPLVVNRGFKLVQPQETQDLRVPGGGNTLSDGNGPATASHGDKSSSSSEQEQSEPVVRPIIQERPKYNGPPICSPYYHTEDGFLPALARNASFSNPSHPLPPFPLPPREVSFPVDEVEEIWATLSSTDHAKMDNIAQYPDNFAKQVPETEVPTKPKSASKSTNVPPKLDECKTCNNKQSDMPRPSSNSTRSKIHKFKPIPLADTKAAKRQCSPSKTAPVSLKTIPPVNFVVKSAQTKPAPMTSTFFALPADDATGQGVTLVDDQPEMPPSDLAQKGKRKPESKRPNNVKIQQTDRTVESSSQANSTKQDGSTTKDVNSKPHQKQEEEKDQDRHKQN